MKRRTFVIHTFIPYLGFGVIVFLILNRALLSSDVMMLAGYDLRRYFYFIFRFWNEAITAGEFPWWNPYLFNGIPFAANPKIAIWYPVNWLLALFPTPQAFAWYIGFHLLIAMTGMYWLLRSVFKSRVIASFTGGLVFGISGFFMSKIYIGDIDMIAVGSYIPLVFGLWWQVLASGKDLKWRHYLAAIGGTVWQFISGYQTIALFTWEALMISAVSVSLYRKTISPVIRLSAGLILTAGLLGFVLLPNREYISLSIRSVPMPYEWSAGGALEPKYLREIVQPFAYGKPNSDFGPMQYYWERAGYVGIAAVIMVFTGIIISKGNSVLRRKITPFVLIGFFAVWVSLADNAPVNLYGVLHRIVPVYRQIRIPARHMVLFVFASGVLTGLGLSQIRSKRIQTVITILVMAELVYYSRLFVRIAVSPTVRTDHKLVSLITDDPQVNRVMVNYSHASLPTGSLDTNQVLESGIYSTNGYETGQLLRPYQIADALNGQKYPTYTKSDVQLPVIRNLGLPFVRTYGATYTINDRSDDPLSPVSADGFRLVTDRLDRFYRLYRNDMASARFFLVPDARITRDIIRSVTDPDFDPRDEVLIETAPEIPGNSGKGCVNDENSAVSIQELTLNSATISVDAKCPMYLVSTETMYPGWIAQIDGRRTQVYTGNGMYKTVRVPSGKHIVRYAYRPYIFIRGAAVSLSSAALLAGVFMFLRRKNISFGTFI